MTTKLTRRTALAGTVTLPAALAPLGLARAATTPNATDAAWAELQAARAHAEALSAESDAFNAALEARLPAHLKAHTRPMIHDFARYEDFKPVVDAWNAERNSYGVCPLDHDGGPLMQAYDRLGTAQLALLDVPGTTATDVERKLSVIAQLAEENIAERAWIDAVLADMRRINGRAA